jgi:MFS family permease
VPGFDHKSSAALNSIFTVGCSVGSLMGGLIADRFSRYYPDSARIICAQFSAFMAIPYSIILLTVIPQSVNYFFTYAMILLLMGLTISWNGACANSPMFAEVVPLKHRTMIYAFDRAFEGSFSSFAAPAVGMVTERIYGYDSNSVSLANGSTQGALALSKGLLTMTIIPWALCCLFYSPLYVYFKRDRENARIANSKEEELELN